MNRPNNEKLGELILYISKLCEEDKKFGATKLNKILFYSDFLSYRHYGKAITNHIYQKLERGPAPRSLLPIRNKLIEDEALAIQKADYHGRGQDRTLALRQPKLDIFTPQEIDLINQIVKDLWDYDGTEVSELSHEFIGWKVAKEKEEIPYQVALLNFDKPTEEEVDYGKSLDEFAKNRLTRQCGKN